MALCAPIDFRRRPPCTGRGSWWWARACRCRPEAGPSIATRAPAGSRGHLAHRGQAAGVQLGRRLGPDTPEPLDGQRVEERRLAVGRHHQQAVGLGPRARHLGEELGAGHADGDGEAHLVAHGAAEAGGDLGGVPAVRRRPPTSRNASSIEMPSTSGRGALEHREHGPARLGVRRHPGLDHHGVGAQQAGLATAHGAAHAVRPGLVAGGHDHPAPDDDRAAAQAGVVALLDRREEGVEVGVQDRGLAGGRSHTNRCSLIGRRGATGVRPPLRRTLDLERG